MSEKPRLSFYSYLLVLFLGCGLLLTACGGTTGSTATAPSLAKVTAAGNVVFDDTVTFGATYSAQGSTQAESNQVKQGYDLWRDKVNAAGGIKAGDKNYKIVIKYYDDQSKENLSGQQSAKLVTEDKVNFLLGPYGSSNTRSVAKVAEENEIPMVEGTGAAEQIFSNGYRYTFGVLSPASRYLQGVIDLMLSQTPKPTRVAIMAANDSFSKEVATAARRYAESRGMVIVADEEYPDKETNLLNLVTKVKSTNPDVVLNSGHFQEAVSIMKFAKETGFSPKAFGFTVGPGLPSWTDLKNDGNYVFSGTQWTDDLSYKGDDIFGTPKAFRDTYFARYKSEPSYQAACGAAVGIAFQRAIEKAGSLEPAKVRSSLASLDFMSFFGKIKFDERGINVYKPMAVEQWQNGKRVTVWPVDNLSTKAIWPTPAWDKR